MAKQNKVCVNLDQSDEQNGGFSDAEKLQARTNIGAGDGKVNFVTMGGQQPVVERSTPYVITSGSGSTYLRNEEATKKFFFVPDFDSSKYGKYAKINAQGKIVWDDAPTGLPAATQQDAGKALILDANGEPIWSDSLIDSEFSFSYNGNIKTEKIKKISAKRVGSTEQGYDHDILAIKSNDFSGIGGNITRVEKEFEMVPHNQNTGFIYSDGLGLKKKEINLVRHNYLNGGVSQALVNHDGRFYSDGNSLNIKAGETLEISVMLEAETAPMNTFHDFCLMLVFCPNNSSDLDGIAKKMCFFPAKEIDAVVNQSQTALRSVGQDFSFTFIKKYTSDGTIPATITIYDTQCTREIYRYFLYASFKIYPSDTEV